ncbi:hypothetical protein VTJ04DRAFT_7520 [Mycothermus thermophilus]|uniref:uncharacterized protein n=1 Tax=Humicola insolens TaxID=85995 RepID=UPI003743E399
MRLPVCHFPHHNPWTLNTRDNDAELRLLSQPYWVPFALNKQQPVGCPQIPRLPSHGHTPIGEQSNEASANLGVPHRPRIEKAKQQIRHTRTITTPPSRCP